MSSSRVLQLHLTSLADLGVRVPLSAVDFLLFRRQVTNRQPWSFPASGICHQQQHFCKSVSCKSQTSNGSAPVGLPWPQDVQQDLQRRFWQGLWFPCNCLLMTYTAVRSGGHVFNNGAWQAKDPKHFSSKYFIFYDLIVRLRLFLPFQSFFTCNTSSSVLILWLPIACLGHDKNLAKSQPFYLAAVHRHNIYMDCNISSINFIKGNTLNKKLMQTAFSDYIDLTKVITELRLGVFQLSHQWGAD